MANSQAILIGKKARRAFISLYIYTLFLFVFNKSQHDLTDQTEFLLWKLSQVRLMERKGRKCVNKNRKYANILE